MKPFSAPISNHRGAPLDCAGTTALFLIAARRALPISHVCCHFGRPSNFVTGTSEAPSFPSRQSLGRQSLCHQKHTTTPKKHTKTHKNTLFFKGGWGCPALCLSFVSPLSALPPSGSLRSKSVSGFFLFANFRVLSGFFRFFHDLSAFFWSPLPPGEPKSALRIPKWLSTHNSQPHNSLTH